MLVDMDSQLGRDPNARKGIESPRELSDTETRGCVMGPVHLLRTGSLNYLHRYLYYTMYLYRTTGQCCCQETSLNNFLARPCSFTNSFLTVLTDARIVSQQRRRSCSDAHHPCSVMLALHRLSLLLCAGCAPGPSYLSRSTTASPTPAFYPACSTCHFSYLLIIHTLAAFSA
ncbi:hypothetical protein LX36DRAFT_149670 [Colletotrichum falcatum]|nr:hypothetical protein LX36DRAFT_149670 [Colletotrichum falcatum]